ncbi:MAG: hypothetical protein KDC44_11305, partial [Phaeodactylibacter sp.]|nr:hypothetical protein [Phaeodactylibacter sp.]
QASGSELEGDATYSVNFTPNGEYLAAVNALSGTLTLFDVELEEQVGIIPLGSAETYQVDFTSDSKYAVVAKRLEDRVAIIDLETMEIVADVPSGGSKPDQVFVLPGDQYAYALNAGSPDRIGVIVLAGANSYYQSSFNVGNMGISWINYGIRADLQFDQTGNYAFLSAPFDEAVQVIDLNAHTVISTMDVVGFPLQIAVGHETTLGTFSAVTLRNSDGIAIINGIGPSASNIGSFSFGEAPTQIAYDAVNEGFVVLSNTDKSIQTYSLAALDFVDQVVYPDHTPIGVEVAADGRKFVLLRSGDVEVAPHYLQIDTAFHELPAAPIQHIGINAAGTLAAVAFPGTDQVLLFKDDAVSGWTGKVLNTAAKAYQLVGNPIATEVLLQPVGGGFATPTELRIRNAAGQEVFRQNVAPGETLRFVRPADWTGGFYFYTFEAAGKCLESGKIVVP